MPLGDALGPLLAKLGIVTPEEIELYHGRTRDHADIEVLRCRRSGVIFLSRNATEDIAYYEQKAVHNDGRAVETLTHTGVQQTVPTDDARRRAEAFGTQIRGKRWADIGAGRGDIVRLLGAAAKRAVAIEPNRQHLVTMRRDGLEAFAGLDEAPNPIFDIITLFHVFEHFTDPLGELERLYAVLAPGGKLLIEVPHARDFLLATIELQAFKDFTFWSEHLVLHTRYSLSRLVSAAGFHVLGIEGVQRYSLSNHFYWLRHGKPGGHDYWAQLDRQDLAQAYGAMLASLDQTDTLVMTAVKPERG